MIKTIQIKSEASYSSDGVELKDLAKINYMYGANGSGKTTISRVIDNPDNFPLSSINYVGDKLDALVYNRDFVKTHFNPDTKLKAIFTLGGANDSIIKEIDKAKEEEAKFKNDIIGLNKTLYGEDGNGGKRLELQTLENEFQDKCWEFKLEYDEAFKEAFAGLRNNKTKFKERLIEESKGNDSELLPFEKLTEKAQTVFSETLAKENIIAALNYTELLGLESTGILTKKVIGKQDVDIADMIKKLGNSDWVKEGLQYYSANHKRCPFCQQLTDEVFAKSLERYFDETYLNDLSAINGLATNYDVYSNALQEALQNIIAANNRFLDCEKLKEYQETVLTKIKANKQHLARKGKEPSSVVTLESLEDVLTKIRSTIEAANIKATEHNLLVDNIELEKKNLKAKVWRYVVDKAAVAYNAYATNFGDISAVINGINQKLTFKEKALNENANKIRALEKSITSIQPTIDSINGLLSSFGFTGFKLAQADKEGFYKIIRLDGKEVEDTLSEGERSFITFLYFYHLLKGSNSESGTVSDRIVVFDDPVSSLDSDVLFIVSNLIKNLLQEVRDNTGHIKQIFILTHNVYFFKEITFNKDNKRRNRGPWPHETFWVVKKHNGKSAVVMHSENPIKTSYELLWDEVRNLNRSPHTIQNTLRRIIENYFRIMGNFDDNKIINLFGGKEKAMCGSLLSWINDGSHCINDDLYMTCDSNAVDAYLEVFRKIFVYSEHEAHYKMMMQIDNGPEIIANNDALQLPEVAA